MASANAAPEVGHVERSPSPTPPLSMPPPLSTAAERAAAVDAHIKALLSIARVLVPPSTSTRSRGATPAADEPEYNYSTLSTHVQALYEMMEDNSRSTPLISRRKYAKTGKFDRYRLRVLQDFVLGVGEAGLGKSDQEKLFNFFEIWDRVKKGMPKDSGHWHTIKDTFATPTAFANAVRDDVEDAVLEEGWKKVTLVEGDVKYEGFFRSAMEVVLTQIENTKKVQLWSGPDGPAPPSDRRDSPLDGDAFKLCEEEVMRVNGDNSCVLGLHLFSDLSQISWSGGTLRGSVDDGWVAACGVGG